MMALKVNAWGVAANAFHDYYQMGESMAKNVVSALIKPFLIVTTSQMFIITRW